MKQQYILLRTENDLLNSLIGQSFNQRTKLEANKILTEIHSKAQDRSIGKMALCYVLDKNEVLGVGGSTLLKDKKTGEIKSNLILNNFGLLLSVLFKKFDPTNTGITIKDITNANKGINMWGNSVNRWMSSNPLSLGSFMKVGSGSLAPARTDFNVQTAFGTSPESGNINAVTSPIYNSGLGNFKYAGIITAGGSGTIRESIFIFGIQVQTGGRIDSAVFRDSITPPVSFIAGQSIALEYTIQL